MSNLQPTDADKKIIECLDGEKSFAVIAGAGSGKTTSLVEALKRIRDTKGHQLRARGQKIVCITYTKRAVAVISKRLRHDDLFVVTTLHGFLWREVARFQGPLREVLVEHVVPLRIEKAKEDDKGGNSKKAKAARSKVARMQTELEELISESPAVRYEETTRSNYASCVLNHDDVILAASQLISSKDALQKGLGFKYPYIFVDEAQDTFPEVMSALNAVCSRDGLPIIGYFGDPMQQIYDKRAGDFFGPLGSEVIPKEENFRCSVSVINLLNKFRGDVTQFPAGKNSNILGSVEVIVAQAPDPDGPRKTYTEEQLDKVAGLFQEALQKWGWQDDESVKKLFLARRMIARRLDFSDLHSLFSGIYSSKSSQSDYENGTHYLLKPFIGFVFPLACAQSRGDTRRALDLLRLTSPAFSLEGDNKNVSLKEVLLAANLESQRVLELWEGGTTRQVLEYCMDHGLYPASNRLASHLSRPKRGDFDPDNEDDQRDKGDWLADIFFSMGCAEIASYVKFLDESSPFSTQHGSKGEEYPDVLVMIDDIEASWNNYSFGKVLTPQTSGEPTERQAELTRKLAYVCFSRAEHNLRILFFSLKPEAARQELIDQGLFSEDQISCL